VHCVHEATVTFTKGTGCQAFVFAIPSSHSRWLCSPGLRVREMLLAFAMVTPPGLRVRETLLAMKERSTLPSCFAFAMRRSRSRRVNPLSLRVHDQAFAFAKKNSQTHRIMLRECEEGHARTQILQKKPDFQSLKHPVAYPKLTRALGAPNQTCTQV